MNTKSLIQQLVPTLYEDEYLIAVTKPSGIDASSGRPGRPPGILELLAELRGSGETLVLTNRLSRYESGILVLAKNTAMAQQIRAEFKRHQVKQEYVAVVLGTMKQDRLVVDTRSSLSKRKAKKGTSAAKVRGSYRSLSNQIPKGRSADQKGEGRTVISALQTGGGRSLVRCRTTVENTHALRAQLRAVRMRLLGDKLHEPEWRSRFTSQTCLHLAKVSLRIPGHGAGIAVSSPEPDAFLRIMKRELDIERPLTAGLTRRLPLIIRRETNAFRLLTGDTEDSKGLVVERFGPVAIVQIHADRPALEGSSVVLAQWYRRMLGLQAVYLKRFVKDRPGAPSEVIAELNSSRPLVGPELPPEIEIMERGMRFLIRPYDGFSVGLFLDQRENRSRVRGASEGKDVLNLFAYTCGFSVAAAAGGACSVTSVDLSSKHLDWGRRNFERNGLDPESYKWIRSDAQDYVKRAERQSKRFDLVVLDPPTFSHGAKPGRHFSIERDLTDLVAGAVDLLRVDGVMLLSTNSRRMTLQGLRNQLREGARGRGYRITATPSLPPDFCNAPGTSKSLIVRFE